MEKKLDLLGKHFFKKFNLRHEDLSSVDLFLVCTGPGSSLTGIQFGDNGSQKSVTEENGVALATTKVF